MHVGTALAVRCNARAASATDLRARYLAPLARCALAANTATATVHTTFTPDQIQCSCSELSLSLRDWTR